MDRGKDDLSRPSVTLGGGFEVGEGKLVSRVTIKERGKEESRSRYDRSRGSSNPYRGVQAFGILRNDKE